LYNLYTPIKRNHRLTKLLHIENTGFSEQWPISEGGKYFIPTRYYHLRSLFFLPYAVMINSFS